MSYYFNEYCMILLYILILERIMNIFTKCIKNILNKHPSNKYHLQISYILLKKILIVDVMEL